MLCVCLRLVGHSLGGTRTSHIRCQAVTCNLLGNKMKFLLCCEKGSYLMFPYCFYPPSHMLTDTLNLCSKGKSMEYIGTYPRIWMNVTETCYKNLKKILPLLGMVHTLVIKVNRKCTGVTSWSSYICSNPSITPSSSTLLVVIWYRSTLFVPCQLLYGHPCWTF